MAVILHCEAAWVSPGSAGENSEHFKVGGKMTPSSPSAGERLLGWFGGWHSVLKACTL